MPRLTEAMTVKQRMTGMKNEITVETFYFKVLLKRLSVGRLLPPRDLQSTFVDAPRY